MLCPKPACPTSSQQHPVSHFPVPLARQVSVPKSWRVSIRPSSSRDGCYVGASGPLWGRWPQVVTLQRRPVLPPGAAGPPHHAALAPGTKGWCRIKQMLEMTSGPALSAPLPRTSLRCSGREGLAPWHPELPGAPVTGGGLRVLPFCPSVALATFSYRTGGKARPRCQFLSSAHPGEDPLLSSSTASGPHGHPH